MGGLLLKRQQQRCFAEGLVSTRLQSFGFLVVFRLEAVLTEYRLLDPGRSCRVHVRREGHCPYCIDTRYCTYLRRAAVRRG